eukprot:gene8089-5626_t
MHSFEPFRVVGSICGAVPVSFTYLYGEPLLMVATGRTFQLYKGVSLRMVRGGPTYEHPISAVSQSSKYRCVAEGPNIHVMVHHKPLWSAVMEPVTKPDVLYLLAQDDLLFAVGSHKHIVVYNLRTGAVQQEIRIEGSESVTALCLPSGYTNKLLVATEEGSLQLYNYHKGVCLWHGADKSDGSPILSLASSVYKDIIAFGTGSGKVVLFHLAEDEMITTFHHTQGAVTALAFRVDKDGFLVSGTSLGEMVVWDIENRAMDGMLTRTKEVRTETEVRDTPHTKAVHSIVVFPPPTTQVPASATEKTAPLLVSCGADNALVQFRFDTVDGLGLMVRERRGHASGCTAATFFNSDLLLTAGADQALRATHVFSDRASWEMSQGRLGKRGRATQQSREELKMPPVSAIASTPIRNYQWSSIVTLHESSSSTCGWRMDSRALEFKLSGIKTTSHTARSIAMSDCGNYAVVGYSSGHAVMMNIQNRSIRQLFDPIYGSEAADAPRAHESSIETVQVANDNTTILTAGLDGVIKFWTLPEGELHYTISTCIPITKSCLHPVSSLLLVVHHHKLDVYHANPSLGLSAQEMANPVRSLVGHTSAITAVAITPDTFRYVVSSSADAMLLLWDIAAAACVGQYRFATPVVSLAFHPDALFLVTAHAGERGAFLWSNNLRYGFVPEVVMHPENNRVEEVPLLAYPKSHGTAEDEKENTTVLPQNNKELPEEIETDEGQGADVVLYDANKDLSHIQRQRENKIWTELNQLQMEGLQLSRTLPRQTWFNLTVLDQIKEKNQPLLPPKKKSLPFFLSTTQEVRPTFLVVASSASEGGAADPQVHLGDLSPFQKLLMSGDYEAVLKFLTRTGHATPQAIDLELRQAVEYIDGTDYENEELERINNCLTALLKFVLFWLRRGEEADFVQGILSNLLRSNAALIGRFGERYVPILEELAEAQNQVRYTMDHLVSFPSCLAGTLSGSIF